MQVEQKGTKEDLVTQETVNPLQYFNHESGNLLITAFQNSSEMLISRIFFEIISSL